MKKARGFTLVEVLVALGIVAIALVAGLQASAALTANAQRQSDVLLAHICAENELIRLRLARQMPPVGESQQDCEQGGQLFQVRVRVAPAVDSPRQTSRDAAAVSDAQRLLAIYEAVNALVDSASGYFAGTGTVCRLVPVESIDALISACWDATPGVPDEAVTP